MQTCYQALTDSQWEVIEKIIADKRERWHSLRTICNAMLWIVHTGSQWRNMESKYPPWQSVYYYFRKWKKTGVWEQMLDSLVCQERLRQGIINNPAALAADSQSVKKVAFIHLDTGIDGGKFINGRKRHIMVDELGLPWSIYVSAANISDTAAGCELADRMYGKVPALNKIACDHAYRETFIKHVHQKYGWEVDIAQKKESSKGFVPQKGRWQVERSFGWLNFRRRLAKDYEKTVESSEAMLQIAFISFLINRLKE